MHLARGNEADLMMMYLRHNGRLGVTFTALKDALKGWDIWVLMDQKPVAVIVEKDGSGHISAYRNAPVGITRMKWALDQLRITKTVVTAGFRKGHALAKRLGFKATHKTDEVTHYAIQQT